MSSRKEKLEAIKYAVEIAKKEKLAIETLKAFTRLDKRQIYQLEMANGIINRGEKLLEENNLDGLADD